MTIKILDNADNEIFKLSFKEELDLNLTNEIIKLVERLVKEKRNEE